MTESDLDQSYTRLCRTMTELGEARSALFLARFALLAIERMEDAAAAQRMIEAAAEDLAREPVQSATGQARS